MLKPRAVALRLLAAQRCRVHRPDASVCCRVLREQLWDAIQSDIPSDLHDSKEQILDNLSSVIRQELSSHQPQQQQQQQQQPLPAGSCWLTGVGPGSKDHVTVRALELLQGADAVVYDDLGAQELLDFAPPSAQLLYVGKRGGQPSTRQADIDKLLVELCQQGKRVMRLKGGCCSTFSRVSSEAAALSAAGISYELVPGVSTATAAAVLAGFPLTDAALAGCYAVVSAHDASSIDWSLFSRMPTLVVLMGARALPTIVTQLQATGWAPDTPVAVVKEAGTAAQHVWFSTLQCTTPDTAAGAPLSPCVIVVGAVAGLPAAWKQQQSVAHQQQLDTLPAQPAH